MGLPQKKGVGLYAVSFLMYLFFKGKKRMPLLSLSQLNGNLTYFQHFKLS